MNPNELDNEEVYKQWEILPIDETSATLSGLN